MTLTLDAQHVYRESGRIVPGVTSILDDVLGSDFDDENPVHAHAAARGTAVHDTLKLHFENDLDTDKIHPEIQPYYEAALRCLSETGWKPFKWEAKAYNRIHGYAGTLDLLCPLHGPGFRLIDWKTGTVPHHRKWGAQTMAYSQLHEQVRERCVVQLSKTGRYKIHPYTDRNDWPRFVACLTVYNLKKEIA